MHKNQSNSEILKFDDSFEISKIIKTLIKNWKIIFKISVYFIIIGIIFSLSLPNKYSSYSVFVPHLSSSKGTNSTISGLAGLAGINLSDTRNNESEISPILYPKIVQSIPFRLELLNSSIYFKNNEVKVRDFLKEENNKFSFYKFLSKYVIGLPKLILRNFVSENQESDDYDIGIYSISREDQDLFKMLNEILSISINELDGFINLSSTYYYYNIPAQFVKNAEKILQDKVIDYKSKSSKELLLYSEKQFKIKRAELNDLQDQIAIFRDKNININSSLFQNRLDRLLSDSQILQNVVTQLASQVEQAKLQVSKDTPVFTVIQPVNIPFEKSGPKRSLLVILFLFFGILSSTTYVLFKTPLYNFIKNIKS